MSKIVLIFIAISFVAANPFEADSMIDNKCSNQLDIYRCMTHCKVQNSVGVCDIKNGCQCQFPDPIDDQKVDNKCSNYIDRRRCIAECKRKGLEGFCDKDTGCHCAIPVPVEDEQIKCLSQSEDGPDPRCHYYCSRKGFDGSFCDLEMVCNCMPLGVPYHESHDSGSGSGDGNDDETIMCLTDEDIYRCRDQCRLEGFSTSICKKNDECQCEAPIHPYEIEIAEDVMVYKHSCNPLEGNVQCFNFCKDTGMGKGICEKEGYCSCTMMDAVPIIENYFL